MKLYLSGPMTGIPDHNFPAFHAAAAELRAAGYEVVNPAELGEHADWAWADYLKRDLRVLLDCDGIAMLAGWRDSRGALLEHHVAQQLGMVVARQNALSMELAETRRDNVPKQENTR